MNSFAENSETPILVAMANMVIRSHHQGVTSATHSLESCLGIALYDSEHGVGGLAHVMLPDSGMQVDEEKETRMDPRSSSLLNPATERVLVESI